MYLVIAQRIRIFEGIFCFLSKYYHGKQIMQILLTQINGVNLMMIVKEFDQLQASYYQTIDKTGLSTFSNILIFS